MASSKITAELRIDLQENATASAPRIAAALAKVQNQSEALRAALARSNLPDKLQAGLAKLRVSTEAVDTAAVSWKRYAEQRGLAGKSSVDWSKSESAAVKQFADDVISANRTIAREEAAREAARRKQQREAVEDARKRAEQLAHEQARTDNTVAGVAALYAAHQAAHAAVAVGERYREFDKERRYAKVVMGLTDEQQKPLVQQAIHGSANSKFNDVQWLAAQRNLAARGYNRDQVLAFTPIADQLGAAFDVPMEEGVKLFEGAMLGFRKDVSTEAKARASAQRTADLEVKTSKVSGADAEDLTALYKRGAASARMAGLTEEQLLAFGGTAKKLNIGGDEAATAFVALTKNLLKPTAEAKVAMHAAGIDYSKYQKLGHLDEAGFVSEVARKYGVRLSQSVQNHLRKIFDNPELMKDPDRLMPAVQRYLRSALGGKDAKSLKSIAGLMMSYRDASMQGVDTQGLLAAIMAGMAKNPALANVIFGSKQGGRIAGALDPEMFAKILDQLVNHSEGFALKVHDARMDGFNGALDKLTNQFAILETSIGRAFDNDGRGGFLTGATVAAGRFVEALSDANPRLLRAGSEAVMLAGAFAALKSVDFLKGGFGIGRAAGKLDLSASALDTSAGLLEEAAIKLGAAKGAPVAAPGAEAAAEAPTPKGAFGEGGFKSIPKKIMLGGPAAIGEYLAYQAVTGIIASITDRFHPAFPKGYDANAVRDLGPIDRIEALWAHLHGRDTPEEAAAKDAARTPPAPPASPRPDDAEPVTETTTPLAGARAAGGPVGAGRTYLVGEHGPELFTAGASGQITSHERLMGALRDPATLSTGDVQRVLASATGASRMDAETAKAVRDLGFDLSRAVDKVADSIDRLDGRALWGRPGDAGSDMAGGGGATPYVAGGSGRGSGGSSGPGAGRGGSDGASPDAATASPSAMARAGLTDRPVESGLDAFNLYGAKHRGEGIRPIDPNAFIGGGGGSGPEAVAPFRPSGKTKGDATFDAKSPQVMARLQRDFGLDAESAAAILGNLGHESAGFNAFKEGGNGPGRGWAQWTSRDRQRNFFAFAQRNHLDPRSDEANYGFLRWELTHTNYRRAIDAVKRAHGLQGKVEAFERAFEGAGVKAYGSRMRYAERAMSHGADAQAPDDSASSVGAFGVGGFNMPRRPSPDGATPSEGPTSAPATPSEGPSGPPPTARENAPADAPAASPRAGEVVGDLSAGSTYARKGENIDYKALVVHHTGMRGTPQQIEDVLNKRGLGVQYTMDRDGTLTRLLPEGSRAAHILKSEVKGLPLSNDNTEGVEVIAKDDSDVTPAQIAGMKKFYADQKKLHPGLEIYGHGYLNPSHKQATEGKTIVDAIRKSEGLGPLNARDPVEVARAAAKDVPVAQRGFLGAYAGRDPAKPKADPLGLRTPADHGDHAPPHDVHAALGALHGGRIAPAVDNSHLHETAGLLDHIHGRLKDIHAMSASARGGGGGAMRVGELNARTRGGFASAGSSFG